MSEFLVCPKCDGKVYSGNPSRDLDAVWFESWCESEGCNFRWIETYEHISNTNMKGYEIDHDGNPIENIILETV